MTAGQVDGFVSEARVGAHLLQTWTAHCCSPAVNVNERPVRWFERNAYPGFTFKF